MRFLLILAVCAAGLAAEDPPELKAARELDREIMRLKDLTGAAHSAEVRRLAALIRQQSPKYAAPLASNLVVDGVDGSRETAQIIAETLMFALPKGDAADAGYYRKVAELVRYQGARVAATGPAYEAATRELEAEDEARRRAEFTLPDVNGRRWPLREPQRKTTLVTFWATWCPPCREEFAELEALAARFGGRLAILAISGEEPETVKRFLAGRKGGFPVLLDAGDQVKRSLFVRDFPTNLIYDRSGNLAGQIFGRGSMEELLALLRKAGLRDQD